MNEEEWAKCKDPLSMLAFLAPDPIARKTLLFTAACCYRIWHILPDYGREWVRLVEKVAEGELPPERLSDDWESVEGFLAGNEYEPAGDGPCYAVVSIAGCGWEVRNGLEAGNSAWEEERVHQAALVREIFGNPFAAPPRIDPAWLAWNDGLVKRLAQGIYEERAFGRMPLLADALLDASCDDEGMLRHCREPGPHSRGCWAVDLCLGKE
jgi:hypothetical protein